MTALRAEPRATRHPPQAGDRVRLVWRPEHTFVVAPSEPLADWEEEHDEGPGDRSIDPALCSGLTQSRFSRRQMLRYAGVGAGTRRPRRVPRRVRHRRAPIPQAVPAVRVSPTRDRHVRRGGTKQKLTDKLEFANWPYYIDVAPRERTRRSTSSPRRPGSRSTTSRSSRTTTRSTRRSRRACQAGQSTGYDIIVMTNGWHRAGLADQARLADPARPPQDAELQASTPAPW